MLRAKVGSGLRAPRDDADRPEPEALSPGAGAASRESSNESEPDALTCGGARLQGGASLTGVSESSVRRARTAALARERAGREGVERLDDRPLLVREVGLEDGREPVDLGAHLGELVRARVR